MNEEKFEEERLARIKRVEERRIIEKIEEKKREKPKENEEEEFEKNINDLKKNLPPIWSKEQILKEFNTYPALRAVYFNVALNQPTMNLMIRKDLGFEDSYKSQIGEQLKKLRRMGLLKEFLFCETFWKNYFNEKYNSKFELTAEENQMVNKFYWRKEADAKVDERKRNTLVGNSGFWSLSKFGKEMLSIAKKDCNCEP